MGFGWRPPSQGENMAEKKSQSNKGQDKMHVMTNPATGEVRTITQADWKTNREQYLAGGFSRPETMEGDND